MSARLTTENLSLRYDKTPVLTDVSAAIPDGKVTSIIGSNACGKSTLLKCLSRLLSPSAGAALLDGKAIHKQDTKSVARQVALLPQSTTSPQGMTVADLVRNGRTPHQNPLQQWSTKDQEIVSRSIAQVGLTDLADHQLSTLSGGQRQRAWIALALAQDTNILLLDEPTTYLDLVNQIEILKLIRNLQQTSQLTVVMVLHDINLATRFSDNLIALKDGDILFSGAPSELVTEENMEKVYGLASSIISDPHTGLPHVIAN
ncbi:ABC transporter ATP-binding protein [Yoonia sp. BS5-3]|uniref:ABC transporter ATP-binding protein n=1 Tax=Yoonia phaeophyticola TaxID=3137369 RepID=A0ABZ3IDZ7_9RHOB